ncbi:MAG: hypothetical protein FJX18_04390 [Alphaproteobacteria bacterium]|nr:hypothetical protein [Alphaproteobacteria bacterium]
MRWVYSFFLIGFIVGCAPYDMATYTRLAPSTNGCASEKIVLISPNLHGIEDEIYQATADWIKKSLVAEGYRFDDKKKATVLVSINHKVKEAPKTEPDLTKTQEVFEGEGAPISTPIYRHHLTVMVEDLSCNQESMILDVHVETYSDRLSDSIPDLLDSLDESFAKTKGPRSKTTKRIFRKF